MVASSRSREMFQSELVYPQEKGELQFTLVPQVRKGGDRTRWIGELVLEYGLTDSLQVELEWSAFERVDPEDGESTAGTGDLELGLKYSWMNIAETGFHSAVGVGLGLPTGDQERGLGEGKTGAGALCRAGMGSGSTRRLPDLSPHGPGDREGGQRRVRECRLVRPRRSLDRDGGAQLGRRRKLLHTRPGGAAQGWLGDRPGGTDRVE